MPWLVAISNGLDLIMPNPTLLNFFRKSFFAAILILSPSLASATTITYTAIDLADSVGGEDLWRYTYTVSASTFDMDFGFDIFFDPSLYEQLQDPPPIVNGDWDAITLQPDPLLPDDGLYDALALVDGASLLDVFTVDFVYVGVGIPGSQPFEVFDPSFDVIESGSTVPIPEPSTAALMALGLVGLAAKRRRSN
jgi:hypothetical protein